MSNQHESHPEDARLYEYLDEALEAHDRDLVEKHLAVCTFCKNRLHEMRFLFETIASLDEEPIGRDLSPIVLRAIQSRNSVARQGRLTVAVQVLLLGILAAVFWSNVRVVLEQWATSSLAIKVVANLQNVQFGISQLWGTWVQTISDLLLGVSSLTARIPLPSWPQIKGAEVFLVVFVGWVAINGLLLRTSVTKLFIRRPR